MKTIKGPAIFLAQFADDKPPFNNLSNIVKNTQEARSRIQDADIAAETTNLTKAQVLNQAAQAMLAQANRTSQSILSLLQN